MDNELLVCEKMNREKLRANDLSMMKGASSWLTTLPVQSESLNLSKREFLDAIQSFDSASEKSPPAGSKENIIDSVQLEVTWSDVA